MEMKKRKAEAEKMAREKKLADMKKKAGAGVAAAKEDIEAKKVAAKAAMAGAQLAAFEQLEKRKAQLAKMKARLGGVDWKALTKRYMPTLVRDDMMSMSAGQILREKKRLAELQEKLSYDPEGVLKDLGEDLGTHDFSDFIVMREQAIKAGTWKYESARDKARMAEEEAEKRKKRMAAAADRKKALLAKTLKKQGRGAEAAALDRERAEEREREARRKAQMVAGTQHDAMAAVTADSAARCNWTGKDDQERALHCTNERLVHPGTGARLKLCAFHAPHCVDDHGGLNVKIVVPNELSRCNMHFAQLRKTQPTPLTAAKVPGVHRVQHNLLQQLAKLGNESAELAGTGEHVLTADSTCNWHWTRKADSSRWGCTNKVFRHPVKGVLLPRCAFHQDSCAAPHPSEMSGTVPLTVPNAEALCATHYKAAHDGKAPALPKNGPNKAEKDSQLQTPGVVRQQKIAAGDAAHRTNAPHPLRPRCVHPDDMPPPDPDAGYDSEEREKRERTRKKEARKKEKEDAAKAAKMEDGGYGYGYYSGSDGYSSPEDSGGEYDGEETRGYEGESEAAQAYRYWKEEQLRIRRKRFWLGVWYINRYLSPRARRAAVKVQGLYRGYVSRGFVGADRTVRAFTERLRALGTVQRYGRGYLGRCAYLAEHARCLRAHLLLQARFRGHLVRLWYAREKAARFFQRVTRIFLAIGKLKAARSMREMRLEQAVMGTGVANIQRFVRGWLGRIKFKRMLAHAKLKLACATDIQRVCRGFLARLIFAFMWEDEMAKRHAVHVIQKMARAHLARRLFRRLAVRAHQALTVLQRRWRGVLERREAATLREAVQFWFKFINAKPASDSEAAAAAAGVGKGGANVRGVEIARTRFEPMLPRHRYDPAFSVQEDMVLTPVPAWKYTNFMWSQDLEKGIAGLGSEHLGMTYDPSMVSSNPNKKAPLQLSTRGKPKGKGKGKTSKPPMPPAAGMMAAAGPGGSSMLEPLRLRGGGGDDAAAAAAAAAAATVAADAAAAGGGGGGKKPAGDHTTLSGLILTFRIRKLPDPMHNTKGSGKPAPLLTGLTLEQLPALEAAAHEHDHRIELVVVGMPKLLDGSISPARAAGLEVGDVIISVGGRKMHGKELWEAVECFEATLATVDVRVLRREGGIAYRLGGRKQHARARRAEAAHAERSAAAAVAAAEEEALNAARRGDRRARLVQHAAGNADDPRLSAHRGNLSSFTAHVSREHEAELSLARSMASAGVALPAAAAEAAAPGEAVAKDAILKLANANGTSRYEQARGGDRLVTAADGSQHILRRERGGEAGEFAAVGEAKAERARHTEEHMAGAVAMHGNAERGANVNRVGASLDALGREERSMTHVANVRALGQDVDEDGGLAMTHDDGHHGHVDEEDLANEQARADAEEARAIEAGEMAAPVERVEGDVYFLAYDKTSCGKVSRREFKVALARMWPGPLLEHEAEQLALLFDEGRNGAVSWRKFLAYAHRQDYPCTRHRRAACAVCAQFDHLDAEYYPKKRRDKDYVRGEILSRSQMADAFTRRPDMQNQIIRVPPEMALEVGIEQREPTKRPGLLGGEGGAAAAIAAAAALPEGQGPDHIQRQINAIRFTTVPQDEATAAYSGMFADTFGAIRTEADWARIAPTAGWDQNQVLPARVGDAADLASASDALAHPPSTHLVHRGRTPRGIDAPPLEAGPGIAGSALGHGIAANGAARGAFRVDVHGSHAASAADAKGGLLLQPLRPADGALTQYAGVRPASVGRSGDAGVTGGVGHRRRQQAALRESLASADDARRVLRDHAIDNRSTSTAMRVTGFGVTEPVPLIADGELKVTDQVSQLYVDVLLAVSDSKLGLLEDDAAFLHFCFNVFVFMERHWRKLVQDVRDGALNKHLPLMPAQRRKIEATLLPQPARARMLDDALRRLGFHYRLSTEDAGDKANENEGATSQQGTNEMLANAMRLDAKPRPASAGAERDAHLKSPEKKIGGNVEQPGGAGRSVAQENSLPDHATRVGRRGGTAAEKAAAVAAAAAAAAGDEEGGSPSKKALMSPRRALQEALTLSKASESPQPGTKRGGGAAAAAAEGAAEEEPAAESALRLRNRPSSAEQRRNAQPGWNSLASTKRQHILHEASAELAQGPRRKHALAEQVGTRGLRQWICAHPGCGKVFSTERGATKHMDDAHRDARRLAVAAPGVDQHMQPYWPAGMPWNAKELREIRDGQGAPASPSTLGVSVKYGGMKEEGSPLAKKKEPRKNALAKKDLSARPIKCPVNKCGQRFADEAELRMHLRRKHRPGDLPPELGGTIAGAAAGSEGVALWHTGGKQQEHVLVPPHYPPYRADTVICRVHTNPQARCPECQYPALANAPAPPLKFYDEVRYTVATLAGAVGAMGGATFAVRAGAEQAHKPFIIGDTFPNFRKVIPVTVHALCEDRNGKKWMAVSEFWSYQAAELAGAARSRKDVDDEHEVLEASAVSYLPIEAIMGHCYVLFVSKREFDHMAAVTARGGEGETALPPGFSAGRVKFSRDAFDPTVRG
jgi:hypothetical protein